MRSFKDPASFARFLREKSATLEEAKRAGFRKGAAIVEADAKARIGQYQAEAGPFPEWRDLAASTMADKERQGYGVPDPLLRTEQMRDSIESAVEPHGFTVGSPDPIALYQEQGTEGPHPSEDGWHVPPRPFLGPALFTNAAKVVDAAAEEVAAWLSDTRPNRW